MNKDIELRRAKFIVATDELKNELADRKAMLQETKKTNPEYLAALKVFEAVKSRIIHPLEGNIRQTENKLRQLKTDCTHSWKTTRTTDDHDGYSWCDYNVTEYQECEICKSTRTKDYVRSYR